MGEPFQEKTLERHPYQRRTGWPWVTKKSTTGDTPIIPQIPLHTCSSKEERKFCARGAICECEWQPGTSTDSSRRTDVPCVVQQGCGRTHTNGHLPWPGTASHWQGPALEPSSRLYHCKNLKQYIFAACLVHSPGSCLVKCLGMGSKQGLFLHRAVRHLPLALRNLSRTTAQKDHTGFPATRTIPSHGGEETHRYAHAVQNV